MLRARSNSVITTQLISWHLGRKHHRGLYLLQRLHELDIILLLEALSRVVTLHDGSSIEWR